MGCSPSTAAADVDHATKRPPETKQELAAKLQAQLRFGCKIRLRHQKTGSRLHSHPQNYPTGSKQQQVTCFAGMDSNDYWIVKPEFGKRPAVVQGQLVAHNSVIRLEHMNTKRNLHSHKVAAPVTSSHFEVSCYMTGEHGDANDNWCIELQDPARFKLVHVNTNHALRSHDTNYPFVPQQEVTGSSSVSLGCDDDDWWILEECVVPVVSLRYGCRIQLQHLKTGCRLHSHAIRYPAGSKQQQVTCYSGHDSNDDWVVKPAYGTPPSMLQGETVVHNAVLRLEHGNTKRNLHSHSVEAHVCPGHTEVSCFKAGEAGDANDNWRIEVDDAHRFKLIHEGSGRALHSHLRYYPFTAQQEVTGSRGRDDGEWWCLEQCSSPPPLDAVSAHEARVRRQAEEGRWAKEVTKWKEEMAQYCSQFEERVESLELRFTKLHRSAMAHRLPGAVQQLDMEQMQAKQAHIRKHGLLRKPDSTVAAEAAAARNREAEAMLKEGAAVSALLAAGPKAPPKLSWRSAGEESPALSELMARIGGLRQKSGFNSAYIIHVGSVDDETVREHWTRAYAPLPEYQRAADQICVEPEWMASTMLLRHLREATTLFGAELGRIRNDSSALDTVLVEAIRKAYKLRGDHAAKKQVDVLSGKTIYWMVKQVYKNLEEWKRPYFVHSLQVLVDLEEDEAAIVAKFAEVCDRALQCRQVQVKSFNVLVSHSYRLAMGVRHGKPVSDAGSGNLDTYQVALLRFYGVFEDFLDDHKEHAFNSSFMEPARFYFTQRGDVGNANNVDTHGSNYFLALLNAALGVHLPLLPAYWDTCRAGLGSFWEGLSDECWQHFAAHCGVGWGGLPALRRDGVKFLRKYAKPGQFPNGNSDVRSAKFFANEAIRPDGRREVREKLAVYLERFAYFFRRDFFVRRAFDVLYSEAKPEHAGFRKACETLYQQYRKEQDAAPEASFLEHCYVDDMYQHLDVRRVDRFLQWLGILKPTANTTLGPANDGAATVKWMDITCQACWPPSELLGAAIQDAVPARRGPGAKAYAGVALQGL